jgi:hypothetical protein
LADYFAKMLRCVAVCGGFTLCSARGENAERGGLERLSLPSQNDQFMNHSQSLVRSFKNQVVEKMAMTRVLGQQAPGNHVRPSWLPNLLEFKPGVVHSEVFAT